jgi:hypothetical protein
MLDSKRILSTKGLRTAVGKIRVDVEENTRIDTSKLLTTKGLRTAVGKIRIDAEKPAKAVAR